ncbi:MULTISPECIES: hypothetical protein [unclassified Lactonifactor]|uniref:hypothetical protein n=1 Tax=unclassified Lactonifactor TaxID=2636670 RepID=UPI001FAA1F28|nr:MULTISPECIES: hypothetical protein [unclassified Lactonifactor]
MTDLKKHLQIIRALHKRDLNQYDNLSMLMDMVLAVKDEDIELAKDEAQFVKRKAAIGTRGKAEVKRFADLYWKSMLFLAQNRDLDSYLLYLEKDRDPEERFYLPRREQFRQHGIVQALQKLIDDEIDILSISCPPGIGKTTLAEMFLSGWIGWNPDLCNLFSSHSGHVTRMVYDVICNIIGVGLKPGQVAEYCWRDIFPDVQIENVNAKEETINLGKFKPFKSITFRALGASQTGVTRAEGLLYCDDLCSGIEEALSKIRLDKLWTKYSTDLKTRKKQGKKGKKCKELHIATRWSVWDVIGRIQNIYRGNDRCVFISVPDIDPETHKSNWNFKYGVGFDEDYFEDIEQSLDDITYKCLYKNEPVEREGILYEPDKLRRYYGVLPDKEPDAILAILDPKGTGTDYNALGVFYQYGQDYYLHDCVFQNIDPYKLDDLNADCLVRNNTQICQIESNKEGVRTGDVIQAKVKERGGRCSIDKKYTSTNKETRIIVNSPWVIEHVIFRAPKTPENPDGYEVKSDYGQMMSWVCVYSQLVRNPHDDGPDMLAMLAVRESGGYTAKAEPMQRPC